MFRVWVWFEVSVRVRVKDRDMDAMVFGVRVRFLSSVGYIVGVRVEIVPT